jgi:glycosyltransferase involved in cell wall biosynthesis
MKDYPTFVAAMKLVPGAHALIAGTGTQELTALTAGDANLATRIHFLGERMDLPRLTAALDIACSSSAFGEGFPNVVAEAMCSGVPCVVTDVGDSAWLLRDAGRVVPSGRPEALAAALKEVMSLPAPERAALGAAGRQRILNHFALPAVVLQFESLLSVSSPHHTSPSTLPCAA